eukprot:TRINITY_DN74_c0_g1_i2.p1 TRINITY_DN74_c0_g1~~TRINITY_DN74_c0_g1_i2.p1  ORF type:complete len:177 (+),score=2.37 TRINITY_DN74_c0_g1_i2:51-581(+)
MHNTAAVREKKMTALHEDAKKETTLHRGSNGKTKTAETIRFGRALGPASKRLENNEKKQHAGSDESHMDGGSLKTIRKVVVVGGEGGGDTPSIHPSPATMRYESAMPQSCLFATRRAASMQARGEGSLQRSTDRRTPEIHGSTPSGPWNNHQTTASKGHAGKQKGEGEERIEKKSE